MVLMAFCLSTNAMFRLVPSGDWSARAFLRILTLSIRRPAYGQRRPMRAGFGGVPLRLPSADFTELLTILWLHAASPIGGSAWTFPGVAPSFRPSDCQFYHGRDLRRRHDAQPFQLRTCRTVVIAVTFQQVHDAPDAQASADEQQDGLNNRYRLSKEIQNVFPPCFFLDFG